MPPAVDKAAGKPLDQAHRRPVRPGATAFTGALAVAALAAAGLTTWHGPDTAPMALLWDFDTAMPVAAASSVWNRRLFARAGADGSPQRMTFSTVG